MASRTGGQPPGSVEDADPLPVYAAFKEDIAGTLTVGKRADFTVLSADLLTIPETDILRARCRMTIGGGGVVFRAKDPTTGNSAPAGTGS